MERRLLEDEILILRPIESSDTDNICRWRNSEAVQSKFCNRDLLTPEIHNNWLKEVVMMGKAAQFIIVDTTEEKDVGTVFIRDIDLKNSHGEFGIFIGENSARGKGLGTKATKLILKYGFEVLNLHKVFLRVYRDNLNAIRAYEKAGFILDGILREDIAYDGEYKDMVIMSILRKEF